jgi:hypothetical protein
MASPPARAEPAVRVSEQRGPAVWGADPAARRELAGHIGGKFWLRTLAAADGIVLAAINAPGACVGERNYDYGPGVGGTLTAGIEHSGTPYLIVQYQPAYNDTLNGADANHLTAFTAVEANMPVLAHLTLTIHSSYYDRMSKYADGTRNRRRFPEIRVFAAYKTAHKPAVAQ